MDRRRAPFYLRRTKEAMVYFPERRADGTWVAEQIFTKRIPHTVDFQIDGAEFDLYRDVTRFVKRESARAAAEGEDPRARAIGFLMSLYQRRLASSTYAMRRSLENRARRLEEGLKRAQELARQAPPDLPDPEELEEMEESERERLEAMLEAITLAGSADQVRQEIQELRRLAAQAQAVEDAGTEAKLSELKELLQKEGFFDHPDQRLLLFTEFKDTLDYLVERLKAWGFRVGCIHGGMKSGSRDEPGTRLHAEQQFREGEIQILVATEAAGEGINLQVCNILFNYDIPWNPNRLEQRMGRIHRYGQRKDCLIFNFVATNTIEGRVLQRLLEKLQEIRDALDDDAVFNVVGEVLPAAHVERVLRDYYAGQLGDADLEERLLRDVDEGQFRAICQNALEGLASKKLNLEMLIERRARAQERRVVPETIARFLREAAEFVPLTLKAVPSLPHAFEPARTPSVLRRYEKDAGLEAPGPRGPLSALLHRPRDGRDGEAGVGHARPSALRGDPAAHPRAGARRPRQGRVLLLAPARAARRASTSTGRASWMDSGRSSTSGSSRWRSPRTASRGSRSPACSATSRPRTRRPRCPRSRPSPRRRPGCTSTRSHRSSKRRARIASPRSSGSAPTSSFRSPSCSSARTRRSAARRPTWSRSSPAPRGGSRRPRRATRSCSPAASAAGSTSSASGRSRSRRSNGSRASSSLPHPEREAPEVRRLKPNFETEAIAMRVVMEHEQAQGRQVYDVSEKNLGYDVTSLDLASGELRLIEVKGLGAATGTILLTPNERRVAEDRRDCYWLYVVTDCDNAPRLQEPIRDPARLDWNEVTKVAHYYLAVNAMTKPMQVREDSPPYGGTGMSERAQC